VMVEKPLGRNLAEAEAFAELCHGRGIAVQVNYWRRSDEFFRQLADGDLARRIGDVQFINGVYCNGFMNNASHIVDFVRMLVGEIIEARALGAGDDGDIRGLALTTKSGVPVTLNAVDANCYRENGLEIWGCDGRLSILVEGLANSVTPRRKSRATADDFELAADAPEALPSTVGEALGRIWGNFIAHLHDGRGLDSSWETALGTERVLAAVKESQSAGGVAVQLAQTGLGKSHAI
jgi:predicted dehydrogenase